MIELINNELVFQFPEVHPRARCRISFERTLRIPDDNRDYPLPPGLGHFPIEHVDDFAERLPKTWRLHGGVFIPMYQSEALWIRFLGSYPCAVKVAAGKINAISGAGWSNELETYPQDYAVIPDQPWLDGFKVSEELIRQFLAMPLGEEYSAEEQLTNKAEHGGLQIIAFPMKKEMYEEHLRQSKENSSLQDSLVGGDELYCAMDGLDMGLAPGGLMRQNISKDNYGIDAWDRENGFRCFVHLTNSKQFHNITGRNPPHKPANAQDYTKAGLPWFEYYDDAEILSGSTALRQLSSVAAKVVKQGKAPMKGNEAIETKNVKTLRRRRKVRDGRF